MSDKKEVTIPEPLNLKIGGELWSYGNTVRYVVDTNEAFNKTGPGIRAGGRIITALEKAETDKTSMSLDSSDLKMLHEAMEKPEHGWIPPLSIKDADGVEKAMPIPGRAFITFVDATAESK